jgi:hypothetical protein
VARERSEHKRLVIVCLSLTFLSLPQVFPGYERASRNWQRGLAQVTLSLYVFGSFTAMFRPDGLEGQVWPRRPLLWLEPVWPPGGRSRL